MISVTGKESTGLTLFQEQTRVMLTDSHCITEIPLNNDDISARTKQTYRYVCFKLSKWCEPVCFHSHTFHTALFPMRIENSAKRCIFVLIQNISRSFFCYTLY